MTEEDILYQNGDYWVCEAPQGKKGFEVYRDTITHAERCAIIGYEGYYGFALAMKECDKRANKLSGFFMKHAIQMLDNELTNVLNDLHDLTQQWHLFQQLGVTNAKNYASTCMDLSHRMALAENRKRDILKALDVLNT